MLFKAQRAPLVVYGIVFGFFKDASSFIELMSHLSHVKQKNSLDSQLYSALIIQFCANNAALHKIVLMVFL